MAVYLYKIALHPYSVIIDSSITSYDGCWAGAVELITLSAAIVVADSLLWVENLFPARMGKFNPRLRPAMSMRVVNFKYELIPGIIYSRSDRLHL